MENIESEEAEAFTSQPPTRGKEKGKGKMMTATSPEASSTSSFSSFFMEKKNLSQKWIRFKGILKPKLKINMRIF
jgi:hypothetical protein